MKNILQEKSNASVFLLTTFLTATAIIVFFAITFGSNFGFSDRMLFYIVYSTVPGIVFIILNLFLFKEKFFSSGFVWNFNIWWLYAWLLPLLLLGLTGVLLYYDMIFGIQPDFSLTYYMNSLQKSLSQQEFLQYQKNFAAVGAEKVIYSMLAQALLLGSTSGAILGFLAEAGWRGFLQREWAFMGFVKSSLMVAVFQSLWFLPLIWVGVFFPENKIWGSGIVFLSSLALGVLLSYVRYRSASVFPVAIARGFFFALFDIPMILFSGGNDFSKHLLGIYGLISMLFLLGMLFLLRKVEFFAVPSIDVLEAIEKENS